MDRGEDHAFHLVPIFIAILGSANEGQHQGIVHGDDNAFVSVSFDRDAVDSVDADIVGQILTATYVDDTVSNLTAAVVDEAFDVFGDDVDNDTFAGILINSKLRKAFMAKKVFI